MLSLLIAVACFGLALIGALLSLRFIYDYRVGNQAVGVVLFRVVPVYRLPFEQIEQIGKTSWKQLGIGGVGALRFDNRFTGQRVLIQKRTGLIRRVVITPDQPDEFISQVEGARESHGT